MIPGHAMLQVVSGGAGTALKASPSRWARMFRPTWLDGGAASNPYGDAALLPWDGFAPEIYRFADGIEVVILARG